LILAGGLALFIDTNVLVEATGTGENHAAAQRSLWRIAQRGRNCISRQVLREYLATVTRPRGHGERNPMPIHLALENVRYFELQYRVLESRPRITRGLVDLVPEVPLRGTQIHDVNIVATMLAYNIRQVLTFDRHFQHFTRWIEILHPEDI